MTQNTPPARKRRQFLKLTAAATFAPAASALAGCGGNGSSDDDGDQNGNGGGGGPTTHTVDMTDELVFDPDALTVAAGDTVVWDNVGSIGHSVTAYEDEIPSDAEYFASGGFDSEQAARDAYAVGDTAAGDIPGGETYEHTFEVAVTYEYFCIPHESAGMTGTITVES